MSRRTIIGALAAVAALGIAGCSSSGSGQPSTTSATTSAASALPTAPLTGAPSGSLTQAQANDALLSASDVGSGFVQGLVDSKDDPLPCTPHDKPLDEQVRPTVKAETAFSNSGNTAQLDEEVTAYADVATAEKAVAAGEKGLSCPTATVTASSGQSLKFTLSGPTDLSNALHADPHTIESWTIKTAGAEVDLVVARLGSQLVVLTFTASDSVDQTTLPSGPTVVTKALEKVKGEL
jgi:hypothetical protein